MRKLYRIFKNLKFQKRIVSSLRIQNEIYFCIKVRCWKEFFISFEINYWKPTQRRPILIDNSITKSANLEDFAGWFHQYQNPLHRMARVCNLKEETYICIRIVYIFNLIIYICIYIYFDYLLGFVDWFL